MSAQFLKKSYRLLWSGLLFISVVLLPALSDAGAVAPCGNEGNQGAVFEISPQVLQSLIDSDPNLYMVDVRAKKELESLETIDQSVNIPLDRLQQGKWSPPAGEKTLVFICRSGRRSLIAARLMARRGCTAYSLKGGIAGWKAFVKPDSGKEKAIDKKKWEEPPDVLDMGC
jgi:rhodanese-related sulfurtransferase